MPLMLILVFLLAAYLTAAPDPVTLRATRGAAGAARAAIGSGRPRSTPARSTPRSGKPRSANPPAAPPRPVSRIGAAIRGGIRSADQAEARRGDLIAAAREWRARTRQRREAARIRAAEDQAHDENDRLNRAAARSRLRDQVKQITDQTPTTNGDPVPDPLARDVVASRRAQLQTQRHSHARDFTTGIPITELATLDDLKSELEAAQRLAAELAEAATNVDIYLRNLPERYSGATDLLKTGQMDASVALLRECYVPDTEIRKIAAQIAVFIAAIEKKQNEAKESDDRSGRVETAQAR